ncbi:MAG: CCDC90 family protein [Magnetococcus sp. MYC-9]
MTAITFDTLKFVETLKASGFDEPQAKGMAVAIQEVQKSNLDEVATKSDLRELKLEIAADMAKVHGEMSVIKWMLGVQMAGVMALILKSFFPH